MIEIITESGISLDLVPDQDIAMTIENPLLSADRIPVAWTTDFELAPSQKNFRVFMFMQGHYLTPNVTSINASIRLNSIPIVSGKLEFTAVTATSFNVSFVGISIDDSLKGSLHEAGMAKWNFGKLKTETEREVYGSVMSVAKKGTHTDFALPILLRDNFVNEQDDYFDMHLISNEIKWASKYANLPKAFYCIPVIYLKYIMQVIFPDCDIDADFNYLVEKIGIVAPYRKNGMVNDYANGYGCLDTDQDGNYILDLASGLPSVLVVDFVKDVLSAICATIFISAQGKTMISNKSIITSLDYIDWSSKVSDHYGVAWEVGMDYEYGYNAVKEPEEIKGNIIDVATIEGCFDAPENSVVRHIPTKDIYEVIPTTIKTGWTDGEQNSRVEKLLSLKEQGRMHAKSNIDSENSYSAISGLTPVKTLPSLYLENKNSTRRYAYIAPIISFPQIGETRSSDIYFGIVHYVGDTFNKTISATALSSNGVYALSNSTTTTTWSENNTNLALDEDDGIYNLFHREFAEWLAKDKSIYSVKLNLNTFDIYNLQLWRKVMLKNQLFFIKTLSISFNTSSSTIETEGEFVKS